MFFNIFHKHYWGMPRQHTDGYSYMTCYECGAQYRCQIYYDKVNGRWLTSESNEERPAQASVNSNTRLAIAGLP